uniref:Helicase ATP-binding domain-containing protein n=1 Tax=Macrostomum lignano TaxID=282301 RepID=A0A1I8HJN7_9PLAT
AGSGHCRSNAGPPHRDHAHNAPSFHLRNIEILVLDEADKLIDEFFIEQIKEIVRLCSPTRQVLLFSATMTDDVRELSAMALRNPVKLFLSDKADVTLRLQQEFVRIREQRESDREAIVAALVQRSFNERCHRVLPDPPAVPSDARPARPARRVVRRVAQLVEPGPAAGGARTISQGRGWRAAGHRSGCREAWIFRACGPSLTTACRIRSRCTLTELRRTASEPASRAWPSVWRGEAERPLLKQIVRKAPIPVKLRTVPKSTVAAYRERIRRPGAATRSVSSPRSGRAEQSLNRVQKRLEAAGSSGSRSQQQQQTAAQLVQSQGGCNSATARRRQR